ncbi:hypothetical protein PBI_VALIDUS_37 [Mycobacterium phage Validus]|uniref:Uncharacterized protein n=1 Tax=Mycobacterium phage Validus TaxID=1414747 RepID=V5URK8_9CAUD|nr:hypothetical protein CC50_gp074 [Mycobacterium phage Validus]AHB79567.1 hypothetical protein PBI_VALIDUS_37 [Mycobacterium phage Validus]
MIRSNAEIRQTMRTPLVDPSAGGVFAFVDPHTTLPYC